MIRDRGRSCIRPWWWDDPTEVISTAADGYKINRWEEQPGRIMEETLEWTEGVGGSLTTTAPPSFTATVQRTRRGLWRATVQWREGGFQPTERLRGHAEREGAVRIAERYIVRTRGKLVARYGDRLKDFTGNG